MTSVRLEDRSLLRVSGPDAPAFLNGLVTTGTEDLATGSARAAALLTPQGKILFDMLIAPMDDGIYVDIRADHRDSLAKRLGFYRLRSDVLIEPLEEAGVRWIPDVKQADDEMIWFADPRLGPLGARAYGNVDGCEPGSDAYHRVRVGHGVAEFGADFGPDTTFPHEANLDLLSGVDFEKGCFVGQEVVSRMQHRGTARKRFVPCSCDGSLPAPGSDVLAGDRIVGAAGSGAGDTVLALLRLDRIADAAAPLRCGDALLSPRFPDWLPRPEAAA